MSSVDEARARVDELNAKHYDLLEQRESVTEAMRANAADLTEALADLDAAERASAVANRPDTTGALAPADPPPTVVVGQATEITTGDANG